MKAKRPIALGIDIAKLKFDAALLMEDGKFKTKIFTNSPQGFIALKDWLTRMDADAVPVCMEATGVYYENLATFLTDKGQTVSVVNPAWIKSFGGGQGVRTKNDKVDACLIARYCAQMRPAQMAARATCRPPTRCPGTPQRRARCHAPPGIKPAGDGLSLCGAGLHLYGSCHY